MNAQKYRKKPVVIEALRFNGFNGAEIERWAGNGVRYTRAFPNSQGGIWPAEMKIETLEGVMLADLGDWIIRGVKGEFYPCKPDIFDATYEPAVSSEEGQ